MKALTLRHPWPWAIVALGKDVENRTWAPGRDQLAIGDWFAIHGGVTPRGADLVEVQIQASGLVATHRARVMRQCLVNGDLTVNDVILPGIVAVCRHAGVVRAGGSPWFEGPLGWRLADVAALPVPVPCRGAQGLWDIPDDVFAEVRLQFRQVLCGTEIGGPVVRFDTREAPLLRGALDLLALSGFDPIRVHSGRVKTASGHWMRLAPRGTADVIASCPHSGRLVAVECKRPKGGRRQPGQAEFLARVRARGGVGIFVADLAVLAKVIETLRDDPFARFNEMGEQERC